MTAKDVVLSQLRAAHWLYENFMKDMSDADMRYQPCPDGIHAVWMLMHLAVSNDRMIAGLSGQPKQMPAEIEVRYAGGSTCRADETLGKADAWKHFDAQMKRAIDFVSTFPESKYVDPAPPKMPPQFPTVGAVIGLLAAHPYWHFGQLTVNRRMLNKPNVL